MSAAADPPRADGGNGAPAPLAPGDRVRVVGLLAHPEKNGTCGTLVRSVDEDRWEVRFDGTGRWAVRSAHLEKLSTAAVRPEHDKLSIAGTWTDWSIQDMSWQADGRHYSFEVRLGSKGEESFQVLVNGDWKARLYPDRSDGCPHERHNLCGPDGGGQGQNWTIGRHPLDRGGPGAGYRVRVLLADSGRARAVDWSRLSVPLGSYTSVSIAGTWDSWRAQGMSLDAERSLYSFEVELGPNGWESFQILLDGDWARCLHPDRADACPHADHSLCGPDGSGHGKNWTIGRHKGDNGSPGSRYMVRLHLPAGGRDTSVDWVALGGAQPTPAAAGAAEAAAAAPDAAPAEEADKAAGESVPNPTAQAWRTASIVGSWNSWAFQEMEWDAARWCYHHTIELGSSGQESFQVVLDSDWKRCLHPDKADGRTDSPVCGPDDQGHGKNWTVGLSSSRKGAPGDRYEVVLVLDEADRFERVDWKLR